MAKVSTSSRMVLRICTLPTSRQARVSTTTIRSSQQSSVIAGPSRLSHTPVFLYACILISSPFQWWCHCGFYIAVYRPPAHDHFVCYVKRSFHSALDSSVGLWGAGSWCFLLAIWRAGCVGCDSHTARRDEPTWIPCYFPRCCIPTRKRTWLYSTMWLVYWLINNPFWFDR